MIISYFLIVRYLPVGPIGYDQIIMTRILITLADIIVVHMILYGSDCTKIFYKEGLVLRVSTSIFRLNGDMLFNYKSNSFRYRLVSEYFGYIVGYDLDDTSYVFLLDPVTNNTIYIFK